MNIYTCFPGGKHKCLTLSYDDGRDYDRQFIALLNEHKIKGTFHLNGGLLGHHEYGTRIGFEEVGSLYQGHEVSAHTYTHPTIERCPITQVIEQVIEDRKVLESACGYMIRGLSYPNGSYSEEIINILPACGIEYARVVGSSLNFAMPRNFLEWKSTCHHNHPDFLNLAQQFVGLNKSQYLYLMYVWGHSYEFEDPKQWENMKAFCQMVGKREDIWYATNIEIVDYMNAAKALKYSAHADLVMNPSAISVWIEVDKEKIEIPGGQTVRI